MAKGHMPPGAKMWDGVVPKEERYDPDAAYKNADGSWNYGKLTRDIQNGNINAIEAGMNAGYDGYVTNLKHIPLSESEKQQIAESAQIARDAQRDIGSSKPLSELRDVRWWRHK